MNKTLLERLRGFQIPPITPLNKDVFYVAHLTGVDFEGIIDSPDFNFDAPYDAQFCKMMIKTGSFLLGGEAGGRYCFVEPTEMSVLLDMRHTPQSWNDAADLQNYIASISSCRMSLQLEEEALFTVHLYAFPNSDLVVAYYLWRRQEAPLNALDRYCRYVMQKSGNAPEQIRTILGGLGPLEKEEVLRQNGVEYRRLPEWQRMGTAVIQTKSDQRIQVLTELPPENAYAAYLQQFLD